MALLPQMTVWSKARGPKKNPEVGRLLASSHENLRGLCGLL